MAVVFVVVSNISVSVVIVITPNHVNSLLRLLVLELNGLIYPLLLLLLFLRSRFCCSFALTFLTLVAVVFVRRRVVGGTLCVYIFKRHNCARLRPMVKFISDFGFIFSRIVAQCMPLAQFNVLPLHVYVLSSRFLVQCIFRLLCTKENIKKRCIVGISHRICKF